MKLICVIPARYYSTRLPGKPLLDICGKPMLQWVYSHCIRVKRFSEVIVATDDNRIVKLCEDSGMNYILTRKDHPNHISRIQEVSEMIKGDMYVSINGDEPLLMPELIETALPLDMDIPSIFYFGAYRKLTDLAEINDCSKIKIVLNNLSEKIHSQLALCEALDDKTGLSEIKGIEARYITVNSRAKSILKNQSMFHLTINSLATSNIVAAGLV